MKRVLLTLALLLAGCDAEIGGLIDAFAVSQLEFESADTNRDGALSASEAQSLHLSDSEFSGADANRDGNLDRLEFTALKQRKSSPTFPS